MAPRISSDDLPFDRLTRLRLYWLRDHGFIRTVWTNFHKLDDQVWRHNQPSPGRIAQLADMGAKSFLSLRGPDAPVVQIEEATCNALNLAFRGLPLRALALPEREVLQDLLKAMREMPKPMVIHCKSGSDRTGLASVLYRHVILGQPLDEAREELALRYIHNRRGGAGVVHRFLDAYETAHNDRGIQFEDWIANEYDRKALKGRG